MFEEEIEQADDIDDAIELLEDQQQKSSLMEIYFNRYSNPTTLYHKG